MTRAARRSSKSDMGIREAAIVDRSAAYAAEGPPALAAIGERFRRLAMVMTATTARDILRRRLRGMRRSLRREGTARAGDSGAPSPRGVRGIAGALLRYDVSMTGGRRLPGDLFRCRKPGVSRSCWSLPQEP